MNARRLLSVILLLAVTRTATGAESYVLVKLTDRADVETVEVMDAATYRTRQAEVQAEAKHHPKALTMARAAWAKDKANTKPFPNGAIQPRRVTAVGAPFDDQAKAEEKRTRIMENQTLEAEAEAKKLQQKVNARYDDKEKRRAHMAELNAREAEKQAFEDKARALYEEQLKQLLAGQAAGAPGKPTAP